MLAINKSLCDLSGLTLVTEASTANLAVGEWPDFIAVVNDAGEGFLFGDRQPEFSGDELCGYRYSCRNTNFSLLVIND